MHFYLDLELDFILTIQNTEVLVKIKNKLGIG